jgi:Family of unknown function (DUF6498)
LNKNFRNMPVRFALRDDAASGTQLDLPRRNLAILNLIVVAMFILFAGVLVQQISKLNLHAQSSVFDLMGTLFSLFWVIGWSVGVLLLGALAIFLLFFGESARLADGRLIAVLSIGPFRMIAEYDLARVSNLRTEADASGERARVLFEYEGAGSSLGDMMPVHEAERIVTTLQRAMAAVTAAPVAAFVPPPVTAPTPTHFNPADEIVRRPMPLASMLVLVAANLIPLFFVLLGEWTLSEVMVLFWAESAVIGFYTLLKMAVVAKWWAPFPGLFFLGHFGGFMSLHFLFIYTLFVRGINVHTPDLGALEALGNLFTPLWPALLGLFISHGVSFALNFIAQREYEGATVQSLMTAPYGRIVVMQFTIIFGGWVVMLLKNTMPALVMLVVFKVVADLRAHYGEHSTLSGNYTVSD